MQCWANQRAVNDRSLALPIVFCIQAVSWWAWEGALGIPFSKSKRIPRLRAGFYQHGIPCRLGCDVLDANGNIPSCLLGCRWCRGWGEISKPVYRPFPYLLRLFLFDNLLYFVRNDRATLLSITVMNGGSFSNVMLDCFFLFPYPHRNYRWVSVTGLEPISSILVRPFLFILNFKSSTPLYQRTEKNGRSQNDSA